MDQLIDVNIKWKNSIIGILIILIGFFNLSFGWIPTLAPYSLMLSGLIAFWITFGKHTLFLFSRPVKPIRNFLIFFPLSIIIPLGISFFLIMELHLNLKENVVAQHVPWVPLPFMLLGEELITFFILLLIAKGLKNYPHKLLIANIVSALCFAFMHILTYWNGDFFVTLLHVFTLQGITRLLYNEAGLKSNTIIVPWIIHILFDTITFLL